MFDTHAHYDDEKFDTDREKTLENVYKSGVNYIVNAADSLKSAEKSIALAEKYPFIYAAVGIHPHNAKDFSDNVLAEISRLCEHKKVVAVGEIGLDYHYDFSPRDIQRRVFAAQIDLAAQKSLPIVIHEREALQDTLCIIKENRGKIGKALWHCFSQSKEILAEVMRLDGFYISLGGVVTFKNAVKAVDTAREVPLDRLLLETDCPYLTPVPHRGERCDSSYMRYTAEKIAQIRGMSFDELCRATEENAKKFYDIKE